MSHAKGKEQVVERGQCSPFPTFEPPARRGAQRPLCAICVPIPSMSRPNLSAYWTIGLVNLQLHTDKVMDTIVIFDQTQGFGYSRSILAAKALKAGAAYIFWLDSDTVVDPDAIVKMALRNKQIVTGVYYNRAGKEMHPVLYNFVSETRAKHIEEVPKGFEMVDAAGLGCCLMKSSVFMILADRVPDKIDLYNDRPFKCLNPETGAPRYNFFCVHESPEGVVTGEDIMFFAVVKKYTAITTWVDPSIGTRHCGDAETEWDGKEVKVTRV